MLYICFEIINNRMFLLSISLLNIKYKKTRLFILFLQFSKFQTFIDNQRVLDFINKFMN